MPTFTIFRHTGRRDGAEARSNNFRDSFESCASSPRIGTLELAEYLKLQCDVFEGQAVKPSTEHPDYDPLFVNSRREAIFIFCLWAACLVWCVPYCYINGYVPEDQEVAILWGLPQWIVLGILVPWLIANVIAILFCIFIFREDDLGSSEEDAPTEASS